MDYLTMIGQRLAIGFPGKKLSSETISFIREYKIGNLVIFRNNVENDEQLRKLCEDIQNLVLEVTGYPAFICIDQEGGMVSRLSPDAVIVPGNMAAAAAGGSEIAYQLTCIISRQLRGIGPNLNFAPVVDVNSNAKNPVIGVRSFGDDPVSVAEYSAAAVRGYLDSGMMCCAKHFPGHGDTAVDSHVGLPVINKSLAELWDMELIPFRAVIEAGVPAIMSSHILFPQIEPGHIPATMSHRIMYDLLREELEFNGLVFSDDMWMEAVRSHFGISQRTVCAVKAGNDVVCCREDLPRQRKMADAILQAVEHGDISKNELEFSFERILAAKEKYAFTHPEPELVGRPEDFAYTKQIAASAVVHLAGVFQSLSEDPFFCGPKDYRTTLAVDADPYITDFVTYMRERFSAAGIICGIDPSAEEIDGIVTEAKKHKSIVLGTCNAHLFRGQLALAGALAETGLPMTVIALRNPYDLREIPESVCKAVVFDYTLNGLCAAAEFLVSGHAPGHLPVRL